MDFKILDASAFYAGIPFGSSEECYTTSLVYDEIKHIKKNHDALGMLLDTNRLHIRDPDSQTIEQIILESKKTGDFQQLSKSDLSVLALGMSMKGQIVTDDFAISNVAKNLGIKVSSVMTKGVKDVGEWVHYCPGCRKNLSNTTECPFCGNPLKRKLVKKKSTIN